jgi:hypothetical protein
VRLPCGIEANKKIHILPSDNRWNGTVGTQHHIFAQVTVGNSNKWINTIGYDLWGLGRDNGDTNWGLVETDEKNHTFALFPMEAVTSDTTPTLTDKDKALSYYKLHEVYW